MAAPSNVARAKVNAGVYAAGDAARATHNIAFAVSGGTFAGVCVHQSLVFG